MNDAAAILHAQFNQANERWIKDVSQPPRSHPTTRASEIGSPCLRYLVLARTSGEKARPVDSGLLPIFEDGKHHEREMKRWLEEYPGWDLFGAQASFPPNNYHLSGHIDGAVWVQTERGPVKVTVEIKSLNGSDYDSINDWTDVKNHRKAFVAKWYAQAQTYLVLDLDSPQPSELYGWAIKNKWSGARKLITCELDYPYAEWLLDRADQVQKHVESNTLPEFIKNPVTCRRCKFMGNACNPPLDFGEGAIVHDDPELVGLLKIYWRLQDDAADARRNWNDVREYIHELLGKKEARQIVADPFLVTTTVTANGAMRIKVTPIADEGSDDDA